MNETLQQLPCLKMSPTPGKENRSSDWFLQKGMSVGWEFVFPSWALKGCPSTG